MKYTYSKPSIGQMYQATPPSRVSPVGASSFNGSVKGGGLFPFLPLLGGDLETPPEGYEAETEAAENALQAEAENAMHETSGQRAQERTSEAAESLGNDVLEKIRSAANEGAKGKALENYVYNAVENYSSKEYGASGHPVEYGTSGKAVEYGTSGKAAEYGASGKAADRVQSGFGVDAVPDAIQSKTGADLLPESFTSAEERLSDLPSVSFQVAVPDPVVQGDESLPVQQALKTKGTSSLKNVQNLPVPDTSQYSTQKENKSLLSQAFDYVTHYQADKMEHPVREIGTQIGASLLAAPVLAGAGLGTVSVPIASSVANVARYVPEQIAQTVQNPNIINFADAVKKTAAGAAAAGAVASQVLPAAAEKQSGWNASTKMYSGGTKTTTNKNNVGAIKGRI